MANRDRLAGVKQADMHTDRFRGASQLLLKRVIAATENGVVREYFAEQLRSEAPLRQQFCDLASLFRGRGESREAAMIALRHLNGLYRTRFKSDHLPLLCGSLLGVLCESDWLLTAPPNLLECSQEETRQIVDVVTTTLQRTRAVGTKRPYSLVSKFLHFCFPDTFAISDSQAARSIQMWAVFAFDEAVRQEKRAASRFEEAGLANSDGHSYSNVLDFYRGVWAANDPDDKALLESKASETQNRMRAESGQHDVRVTAIDVIDKLLWQANGNPILLGLAVPPPAKRLDPSLPPAR
jgi:hypothetical protein